MFVQPGIGRRPVDFCNNSMSVVYEQYGVIKVNIFDMSDLFIIYVKFNPSYQLNLWHYSIMSKIEEEGYELCHRPVMAKHLPLRMHRIRGL